MDCNKFFAALAVVAVATLGSAQIQLNQVDEFTNLDPAFWSGGAALQVVANGGPNGTGDPYLSVTGSGLSGASSVPAAYNQLQWTGNWQSQGVKVLQADLKNFSSSVALNLRLVLHDDAGTRWTSTNGVALPTSSGWIRATFLIRQSDFTRVLGSGSWNTVTTNCFKLMIRHDSGTPSSGGTAAAATFGIDNIRALDHVPVLPTTVNTTFGVVLGGNVASLQSSNNNYYAFLNDEFNTDSEMVVASTSPLTAPSALRFKYECWVSRPNVIIGVDLFNYNGNDWDQIDIQAMPEADTLSTVNITTGANLFVKQSDGTTRARFRVFPSESYLDAPDWTHLFDLVKWEFIP